MQCYPPILGPGLRCFQYYRKAIIQGNVVCIHQKSVAIFGFILFSPGDGQFTAPPPTCPGDTFTFRCNVTGDRNGDTRWKVGGSSECILGHSTPNDPRPCGSGSPFTVTTGTGFGTNATSFSSTLSGTAIPALDGTLVECFDQDVGNMIGNSTLQILGQYQYHVCLLLPFIQRLYITIVIINRHVSSVHHCLIHKVQTSSH